MPATLTFTPSFAPVAPKASFDRSPAPIGAGGFVRELDLSADGLRMVHCADVQSGGYIRDDGDPLWASMFSPDTLLSAEYDPLPALVASDGFRGLAGVRIAPSNKDVIYSLWGSLLFKSTDGGASQRRTSFGTVSALSNSGFQRYSNRLIDVHPTDPLIILVGSNHYAADTSLSGAFYSFDGAATAKTKISGLPSATDRGLYPDRYLVAFDPGDPTKAYVHVGGSGLYPITVGAGTMTAGSLIAGSPTRCTHLTVTAAGVVYIAAGGQDGTVSNDLYKRTRAGTASTFTTGAGSGCMSVAVDPANANRIVCADQDGALLATYNGGTNWELFAYYQNNLEVGSGEIDWLSDKGFTAAGRIFPGMLQFDTQVANRLWIAHGTGISYGAIPTSTGGTITLHDFSKGNEEKVAMSFLSVPGNRVTILGNWDYSIWPMVDLEDWTNEGIIPAANGLAIATDFDFAIDDPDYYVCAIAQNADSNAHSFDKGITWSRLPNQDGHGYGTGAIAVSNADNIITIGTDNAVSRYTKDGGATWNDLILTGGVTVANMNNAQYLRRKIVTADKERPGVFALIVPGVTGGGSARSDAGLWITEDGGDNWTKTIAGIVGSSLPGFTGDTRQFFTEKLRYIPGFSGEMLHTCHDDLGPDWLHHITDDGTTIARLGGGVGVTDVTDFDFGPVMPGETRPCVGFWGTVDGVEGAYISYDWFATEPVLVSRFPLDNLSVCPNPAGTYVIIGMDRNRVRMFVGGIGWNVFD